MANPKQVCFMEDGLMFCNAIMKNGRLIFNPSGKWFRFVPKERAKKAKEDAATSSDASEQVTKSRD